jgi:hypothetical protein
MGRKRPESPCQNCGATFLHTYHRQYLCAECRPQLSRARVGMACLICGGSLDTHPMAGACYQSVKRRSYGS